MSSETKDNLSAKLIKDISVTIIFSSFRAEKGGLEFYPWRCQGLFIL